MGLGLCTFLIYLIDKTKVRDEITKLTHVRKIKFQVD